MTLFGTAGIRGPVGDMVTPELAVAVGRAAGEEASEVVVGRDARPTGEALVDALSAGIESGGARIIRVGRVPTPALAFASRGRHGAMVTASHNPPGDNGIKLFENGYEFDREAEEEFAHRVEVGLEPRSWNSWGTGETEHVLEDYRNAVTEYASMYGAGPEGLAISVDCGNGTAGLVAPQILTNMGVRVHAHNADLDGHRPARDSKPTPESLGDLRSYVTQSGCELGFGFDGDGDRIVVVNANGEVIHEDTILAILAHHFVTESQVSDPVVVTTPNASQRVDERVKAAGGRVERVRLGALHEGVASVRTDAEPQTTVVFAAEPWKHVHPDFGGWIDAVASMAVIVRLIADTDIAERVESVNERPYRKVSLDCPDEQKNQAMATLAERLSNQFPDAAISTEHGLRLDFSDGSWALIRPSGTEPKLRIYAESDEVDEFIEDVSELAEAVIVG